MSDNQVVFLVFRTPSELPRSALPFLLENNQAVKNTIRLKHQQKNDVNVEKNDDNNENEVTNHSLGSSTASGSTSFDDLVTVGLGVALPFNDGEGRTGGDSENRGRGSDDNGGDIWDVVLPVKEYY
ncbi:hypothetical protein HELRODRAFT_161497 [Helobdella robusta]|uniref:Uncharacterized protein n=1 Tax=Helobdella robusta TaxID=6412 RepID=T1ERJ9_HELRO|nr:hypothetical protein HELRODRAFT_161497 [Helobdella robusta]ESO02252.1 hypothetical protein HELRODRAFT_161497 [Helobdella robusta]